MNGYINMFPYCTPTRREISSYSNNKGKFVGSETIGKSLNLTIELF